MSSSHRLGARRPFKDLKMLLPILALATLLASTILLSSASPLPKPVGPTFDFLEKLEKLELAEERRLEQRLSEILHAVLPAESRSPPPLPNHLRLPHLNLPETQLEAPAIRPLPDQNIGASNGERAIAESEAREEKTGYKAPPNSPEEARMTAVTRQWSA